MGGSPGLLIKGAGDTEAVAAIGLLDATGQPAIGKTEVLLGMEWPSDDRREWLWQFPASTGRQQEQGTLLWT